MTDTPRLCSVIGCPNGNLSKLQQTILYFVPKNPSTAKKWLAALKDNVSKSALSKPLICKEHFEPNCFIPDSKRLTPNAVPTIFSCNSEKTDAPPSKRRRKGEVYGNTTKEVKPSKSSDEDNKSYFHAKMEQERLKNDPDASDDGQNSTSSDKKTDIKKEESFNESEKNKIQGEEGSSSEDGCPELNKKLGILQLLKENLIKERDQIDKEDKVLQKQIHLLREKLTEEKFSMKELPNKNNKLLKKCFSDSQIRTLMGQQKSRWAFDDLAVAYNIITLTNSDFYMYLRSHLKYPLPAYSNLNRFMKRKEREENDGNSADNEAYDAEFAEENSTEV